MCQASDADDCHCLILTGCTRPCLLLTRRLRVGVDGALDGGVPLVALELVVEEQRDVSANMRSKVLMMMIMKMIMLKAEIQMCHFRAAE